MKYFFFILLLISSYSYSIDYSNVISYELNPQSDELLISFAGNGLSMGHIPLFEFKKSLTPFKINKIFVKDLNRYWYLKGLQTNENETIYDVINELSKIISKINAKKVITLGNSAGGYAAILFGILLKVDKVHAFVPQTLLTKYPNFLKREHYPVPNYFIDLKTLYYKFPSDVEIHIYYDNSFAIDRVQAENFKEVPNTVFHTFFEGKHSLIHNIKKQGKLNNLLETILK